VSQQQNKYLIMDFWEFAIIATLMTAFFPWSLLFCVLVYGIDETKLIVAALFHDFVKTVIAVLAGVGVVVTVIICLVIFFSR
jgi:hypothetical protein